MAEVETLEGAVNAVNCGCLRRGVRCNVVVS